MKEGGVYLAVLAAAVIALVLAEWAERQKADPLEWSEGHRRKTLALAVASALCVAALVIMWLFGCGGGTC